MLAVFLGLQALPGAVVLWAHLTALPGTLLPETVLPEPGALSGLAVPASLGSVLGGSGLLILAETVSLATALVAVRLPRPITLPMLSCAGIVVARLAVSGLQLSGLSDTSAVAATWDVLSSLVIALGTLWLMWISRQMLASRQQLLNDRAERDALTGLLGRAGLSRRVSELTGNQDAALMMFDLNDLKSINDTGGHSAGDDHLQQVAQAIEAALPPGALLGRWGGDEFLAALPRTQDDVALKFADSAAAHAPRTRRNLPPFAVGVAQMRAGEDMARALAVADQQMYENKAASRLSRLEGAQVTAGRSDSGRASADRASAGRASAGRAASGARTDGRSASSYVSTPEEFTRMLEGLETKHAILHEGLDTLRRVLGFDGSSYYQQRGELMYPTYVTGEEEITLADLTAHQGRASSSGIVSRAIETSSTVGTADYPSDPDALSAWIEHGLKSVVVTPVRDAGVVVGILDLTSYRTWRAITPQVCRLLEAVALRLGHVLERDRVVAQVQHTFEGSLVALGMALEARDFESFGHTERVVAAAELLGGAFDLGSRTLLELRQGAYLHDIGKLTIPDAVLLKPGKLDAEEYAVIQRHAAQGHALASRIAGISAQALDVILSHHERWDGQGYPAGLSGEAIPLLARIFAVCDVYDALTSARPYKPAWTVQAALQELEAQAGQQFDPRIVTIFTALVRTAPPTPENPEPAPQASAPELPEPAQPLPGSLTQP